ncbi:MAG: arsenate reductase [Candidatus Electronema aureum]|uniref:Arsenate reductase n=1 Tax=Candidatus Electronema aureum TaxID=2005002 RepID=A0A521FZ66_9BACT|nr:MAG: arsenate reductase [Candidatus Electronema aureum]
MAERKAVLFVCIHNSARSQMAEAFLQQAGGGRFEAASAGIEAGRLNPLAVETMQEIGIDISGNAVTNVFDLLRQGKKFDYVITVCDDASGERCPLFPGQAERLHWPCDDPAKLTGSHAEQLERIRQIREQLRQRVAWFVEERRKL